MTYYATGTAPLAMQPIASFNRLVRPAFRAVAFRYSPFDHLHSLTGFLADSPTIHMIITDLFLASHVQLM